MIPFQLSTSSIEKKPSITHDLEVLIIVVISPYHQETQILIIYRTLKNGQKKCLTRTNTFFTGKAKFTESGARFIISILITTKKRGVSPLSFFRT